MQGYMSRDTRKSAQKFGPPKHPIQVEATLKTIQPTHTHTSNRLKAYGTRVLTTHPDADIRAGIAHQLAADDWQERKEIIDTEFKDGFDAWLAGNSKWNNKRCFTPWERQPLFHVPGVVKYFDSQIDVHEDFRKCLIDLRRNGPQNINQAYLYYKYIVRARDWRVENAQDTMSDPPWFDLAGKLDFLDKFSMDATENDVDQSGAEKYDENAAQAQTRSSQTLTEANTEQSDTYDTLPPYGAHAGAYLAALRQRRVGGNIPAAPAGPAPPPVVQVVQDPKLLKQLQDYKTQMDNLTRKIQDQDKQSRDDAAEKLKLDAELKKARQDLGAVQKGLQGANKGSNALTVERDQLAAKVANLEAAQKALVDKAVKRKAAYEDMSRKYAAEQTSLAQRTSELNALRLERDRYKGDAEKLQKDLDAKAVELAAAAKRTVDTAAKGQEVLAAKIAEQNEELEKLRKQAKDSENDANGLIKLQAQIDDGEARLRGFARQAERLREIQELADVLNRQQLTPEVRVAYAQQLETLTRQLERNSDDGAATPGQVERAQINAALNQAKAQLAAAVAAYEAIPEGAPAIDVEAAQREIEGLVQLVEQQKQTAENLESLARGKRPEIPDDVRNSPPLTPPVIDFASLTMAPVPRSQGVYVVAQPSGFAVDVVVDPETGIPYAGTEIPPSDHAAQVKYTDTVAEMERWIQYLEDPNAFTQQYSEEPPPITDPNAEERYLRAYPYILTTGRGAAVTLLSGAGAYTALAVDIPPPPAMHYATYRAVKYRYMANDGTIDYARMESELGSAVADEVYFADDFYRRSRQLLDKTPATDLVTVANLAVQEVDNITGRYYPGTTQKPRLYRSVTPEMNSLLYSPETRAMILPKVKAALEAYKYDQAFASRYRAGFTPEQLSSGLEKLQETLANDQLLTAGGVRPAGYAYNPRTYRAEMIATINTANDRARDAATAAGQAGHELAATHDEYVNKFEKGMQAAQEAGSLARRLAEFEADRATFILDASEQAITASYEAGRAGLARNDDESKPITYRRAIKRAYGAGEAVRKLAEFEAKRAEYTSAASEQIVAIAFESGLTDSSFEDSPVFKAIDKEKSELSTYMKFIDNLYDAGNNSQANRSFNVAVNRPEYKKSTWRSSIVQMDADDSEPAASMSAGDEAIRIQRMQERDYYDAAPENARQARQVVQEASARIDELRAQLAAAQAPTTTPVVTREAQAAQVELLRGQVEELNARLQSVSGDTPFADYIESLRNAIEPLRAASGTSGLDGAKPDGGDGGGGPSIAEVARLARELEKQTEEYTNLKKAYDEAVAGDALGKENLKKAQATIDELTKARKVLTAKQKKKLTAGYDARITSLKQEIEARQAEIEKLKGTVVGRDEAVSAAEEKLALLKEKHEDDIGKLRRELQANEQSRATSVKDATDEIGNQYRAELKQRIEAAEKDYAEKLAAEQKKYSDLQAEGVRLLSERNVEINTYVERQAEWEREKTSYEQRITIIEQERLQLIQRKGELESQIQAMNEYGMGLENEHEEAKRRLLAGQQAYEALAVSLQTEKTKLQSIENNMQLSEEERTRLIAAANAHIAQLLQQQAQTSNEQTAENQRILSIAQRIEADRDRLTRELAQANAQLAALNTQQERERGEYNASYSQAQMKLLEAQSALTAEQAARLDAQRQMEEGRAATEALNALIGEKDRLVALRDAEIQRQNEEIIGFDARVAQRVEEERRRLQQQYVNDQTTRDAAHQEELANLRRELANAQQAKVQVEASVQSLSGNAELLSQQIAALQLQVANAQAADRGALVGQITRLTDELGQTQTARQQALEELAAANQATSNAETTMRQVQTQYNQAAEERRLAVKAVQDQLDEQLLRNRQLDTQISELNAAKAALESRISAADETQRQLEETLAELTKVKAEKEEIIAAAKLEFAIGNAEVARLQGLVQTQKTNIQQLQTSLDEKVEALRAAAVDSTERDKLLDEISRLTDQRSGLEQTKQALEGSITSMLAEQETERTKLEAAQSSVESQAEQIRLLTGERDAAMADRDRLQGLANGNAELLAAAQASIQQLQEQVRVRDILPDTYRLADISSAPELYTGAPATEATMRALHLDVERYREQTARLTTESSPDAKQTAIINGLIAAYTIMRQNASASAQSDAGLDAAILPPEIVLETLNQAEERGVFNTPETQRTRDFVVSILQSAPVPETTSLQRLGIEVGLFREQTILGATVRVPVIREVSVQDLTGLQDWPSGAELRDIQYAVYRDSIDLATLFKDEWAKMENSNFTLQAYNDIFATLEANQEALKDPETRRGLLKALKRATDQAKNLNALSTRMDQLLQVNKKVTEVADDISKVYNIMNSLRTIQEESQQIAAQLQLTASQPEIGPASVEAALDLIRQRNIGRKHAAEQLQLLRSILDDRSDNADMRAALESVGVVIPSGAELSNLGAHYLNAYFGLESVIDGDPLGNYILKTNAIFSNNTDPVTEAFWQLKARRNDIRDIPKNKRLKTQKRGYGDTEDTVDQFRPAPIGLSADVRARVRAGAI